MNFNIILDPKNYFSQQPIENNTQERRSQDQDSEGVPPAISPDTVEIKPLPRAALLEAIKAENLRSSQSEIDIAAIRQAIAQPQNTAPAAAPTYNSSGDAVTDPKGTVSYEI